MVEMQGGKEYLYGDCIKGRGDEEEKGGGEKQKEHGESSVMNSIIML